MSASSHADKMEKLWDICYDRALDYTGCAIGAIRIRALCD